MMKKLALFLITATLFAGALFAQSAEVEERLLDAERKALEAEKRVIEAEKRALEAERRAFEAEKREAERSVSAPAPVVAPAPVPVPAPVPAPTPISTTYYSPVPVARPVVTPEPARPSRTGYIQALGGYSHQNMDDVLKFDGALFIVGGGILYGGSRFGHTAAFGYATASATVDVPGYKEEHRVTSSLIYVEPVWWRIGSREVHTDFTVGVTIPLAANTAVERPGASTEKESFKGDIDISVGISGRYKYLGINVQKKSLIVEDISSIPEFGTSLFLPASGNLEIVPSFKYVPEEDGNGFTVAVGVNYWMYGKSDSRGRQNQFVTIPESPSLVPGSQFNPDIAYSSYFVDVRDGQEYRTVRIGNRTWMAENLNYAGHPRGNSWCSGNDNSNCDKYGRLYDWDAAMSACPAGWRLPVRKDWDDLVSAAGGSSVAGRMLKSRSGWRWRQGGDVKGTDDFGFSALPGGYRWGDGSFDNVGNYGYWWSATEFGSGDAYYWNMGYRSDNVIEDRYYKDFGFSARCVRDERP